MIAVHYTISKKSLILVPSVTSINSSIIMSFMQLNVLGDLRIKILNNFAIQKLIFCRNNEIILFSDFFLCFIDWTEE